MSTSPILEVAIDGYQRFPGAEQVAEAKLARVEGDPQLAIAWPIEPDPALISEKDLSHPPLAD